MTKHHDESDKQCIDDVYAMLNRLADASSRLPTETSMQHSCESTDDDDDGLRCFVADLEYDVVANTVSFVTFARKGTRNVGSRLRERVSDASGGRATLTITRSKRQSAPRSSADLDVYDCVVNADPGMISAYDIAHRSTTPFIVMCALAAAVVVFCFLFIGVNMI